MWHFFLLNSFFSAFQLNTSLDGYLNSLIFIVPVIKNPFVFFGPSYFLNLKILNYSTLSKNENKTIVSFETKSKNNINPNWITGFVDAEGCFTVSINSKQNSSSGFTLIPEFTIKLHSRDFKLPVEIQNYLNGIGSVLDSGGSAKFSVRSKKDLKIILNHFFAKQEYPLIYSKYFDLLYFRKIVCLIEMKAHLLLPSLDQNAEFTIPTKLPDQMYTTTAGGKKYFLYVLSLINKLNRPISPSTLNKLKVLLKDKNLPESENIDSSTLNKEPILNPFWISGFATGEGSFTYYTRTRLTKKSGLVKDVFPAMEISQHTKDKYILTAINNHFAKGFVHADNTRSISKFKMTRVADILNVLFPFFKFYPLSGHKLLQYTVWKDLVLLKSTNLTNIEKYQKLIELSAKLSGL